MKKILLITGITLMMLLLVGGIALAKFIDKTGDELKALYEATVITTPELSQLADGEYIGQCDWPIIKVKVKVTVQDHQIATVEILKHDNGRGKPAEAIIQRVIAGQTLDVDVISGATYSSTVILSAIQEALNSQ